MTYDIFVIGGGVNGCAIARDAQGRGLSVFLAEQDDIASGTSQSSTKLIHGGLRYLEHYKFRLVREALMEREVLLQQAPHIIWPLRFVLPHHSGLRSWSILRLGLYLYDHLGGRKILPPTRSINFSTDVTGGPLKPEFSRGFEYSDCWVDDARFVVLTARDAAERGATIRTRTQVKQAVRTKDGWDVTVVTAGKPELVRTRILVNAAGPWVSQVLGDVVGRTDPDKVRMVKGSHIVVDKLYEHDRSYIFQNADGRICFAIPYEQSFTLIGTTDEEYHGEANRLQISHNEIEYLLNAAGDYFKQPLSRNMIRWSYSGIRPLYDDGASSAQNATRDYVLKLDAANGAAPLLSVFGGKITTARKLAEAALLKLQFHIPKAKSSWTESSHLPGGNIPYVNIQNYISELQNEYSFIEPQNILRLFRAYGTEARNILGKARSAADLGKSFGALSEAEVQHLMINEFALTSDDILWRRSKLGLHMKQEHQSALKEYLGEVRHNKASSIRS